MTADARLSRLRWRCRRGMKELDLMLERFLIGQEATLVSGGWPELEALLEAEDDRLWDWLRDPSTESAEPYRRLLENIRDEAR